MRTDKGNSIILCVLDDKITDRFISTFIDVKFHNMETQFESLYLYTHV